MTRYIFHLLEICETVFVAKRTYSFTCSPMFVRVTVKGFHFKKIFRSKLNVINCPAKCNSGGKATHNRGAYIIFPAEWFYSYVRHWWHTYVLWNTIFKHSHYYHIFLKFGRLCYDEANGGFASKLSLGECVFERQAIERFTSIHTMCFYLLETVRRLPYRMNMSTARYKFIFVRSLYNLTAVSPTAHVYCRLSWTPVFVRLTVWLFHFPF